MNIKLSAKRLKRYWFEILIIIIIILLVIFYSFNPNIVTFFGLVFSLMTMIAKSFKERQGQKETKTIILNNIGEIFKDIHTFQNIPNMNKHIFEKFNNLKNNFGQQLKEFNCYIEEIEGSKAMVIYLKDEKVIARPEQRIMRQSKEGRIFLENHNDIDNLMEEIKNKV